MLGKCLGTPQLCCQSLVSDGCGAGCPACPGCRAVHHRPSGLTTTRACFRTRDLAPKCRTWYLVERLRYHDGGCGAGCPACPGCRAVHLRPSGLTTTRACFRTRDLAPKCRTWYLVERLRYHYGGLTTPGGNRLQYRHARPRARLPARRPACPPARKHARPHARPPARAQARTHARTRISMRCCVTESTSRYG